MNSGLAAAVLLLVTLVSVNAGGACYKDFKNMKDIEAIIDKCETSLGIMEEDIKMNPEDMAKNGYEDKCFMKCILVEMKQSNADGVLDFKAIGDDLTKNAPAGKADALIKLMKDCAETTAKNAVISKDACKSIAMTKVCFMTGQDKICS